MTVPARGMPEDTSRSGREQTTEAPARASSPAAADVAADTPGPAGTGPSAHPGTPVDAGGDEWSKIQAMFVDNPRDSVTAAPGMVDDAISAFIETARKRQAALASSWQDQEAGTEELRTALQNYRAFWNSTADSAGADNAEAVAGLAGPE